MLRNAVASPHCFIISLGGRREAFSHGLVKLSRDLFISFTGQYLLFEKGVNTFSSSVIPTLQLSRRISFALQTAFVGVASPLSAVLRRRGSIKPLWKFCLKPKGASFALCVCGEDAKGPWHIFWYLCFGESKRSGRYDVRFRRKQNIGILIRSVALSHRENVLLFYNSDSCALFSDRCDLFWTHFRLGFEYPCNGFPYTLRF